VPLRFLLLDSFALLQVGQERLLLLRRHLSKIAYRLRGFSRVLQRNALIESENGAVGIINLANEGAIVVSETNLCERLLGWFALC
jgi:hypothetical protein